MTSATVLVLRFNAYSGELMDGYFMNRKTKKILGKVMQPKEVLKYLIENPETSCEPIEV